MDRPTLTPSLTQVILFILVSVPPLSQLLFTATRATLRSRWEAYRNASEEKQVKSARNIAKSLLFFVLFFAFLPMTIMAFRDWSKGQFLERLSDFRLYYSRVVISIIPAFFVYELTSIDEFYPFLWLHHGASLAATMLVLSGTLVRDEGDASGLIKTAVLLYQIVCLETIFFSGHGISRILPVSRLRFRLLCYLAWHNLFASILFQVMLWAAFGAHAESFSTRLPIVMASCLSLFILIANAHTTWITFSIAKGVRKRWIHGSEEKHDEMQVEDGQKVEDDQKGGNCDV